MLASIVMQMLGVMCLSVAMDKHYKALFKQSLKPLRKRALRLSGCLAITLSIFLFIAQNHVISIAIVNWLAFLSFNILLLAVLLCWKGARDK